MKIGQNLVQLAVDPIYRPIWLAGGCIGVARWLDMLVVGIFAFEVTGSPFLVSLLILLRTVPLALFGSITGTLADRGRPRLLLCTSLALAALVSFVVCLLFVLDLARYWHIAVATLVSGIFWTTDMPLRRRLLGDAAGPSRLAAAMSLDSATVNATRMLGPALGGAIYGFAGPAVAFGLTSVLFVAAFVFIAAAPVSPSTTARKRHGPGFFRDHRAVFQLIASNADILRILLVTVVINVWGFPFVAMIPVIGTDDLGLTPAGIGGLAAMEGAGSFVGAVLIAAGIRAPSRRLYFFGTVSYLVMIFIAGSLSHTLPIAAVLLLAGLGVAGFTTMQTALIYAVAPPDMRGRLLGALVFCIGIGLIGHLNVGLMGEMFGGAAAMRIIAIEGLLPLFIIGISWRELRVASTSKIAPVGTR